MSVNTSSSVGNVALIASGTGGVVAAVNEYAVIIGLAFTFISIVIGLIFHVRADRWRKQESAAYRETLTRQILQELQQDRETCDPERSSDEHPKSNEDDITHVSSH